MKTFKQFINMPMIEQKKYADIHIDDCEKDIILIISAVKIDPQIVMVERANIPQLIEMLQSCLPKVSENQNRICGMLKELYA